MSTNTLITLSLVLSITLGISACATPFSAEQTHSPLAADIYAQLALGYMESGHLELAHQRLLMALELGPNRPLTLKALQGWQKQQTLQQQ
ncbi:MAG TPA: hypothetical protein EYQ12_08145 [Oceanospirillaceae bacterium]|nr:hypothetical protein [Oceanospirillaceae bacterium]